MIEVLNPKSNYWLVRTMSGAFYNEYTLNDFIAIGWNQFSDLDRIKKANTNSEEEDKIKKEIKEWAVANGEFESQPGRAYGQISKFVNDMKIGDIILIPSEGSAHIAFGVITSNAFIEEIEPSRIAAGNCDFIKRRQVQWVKKVPHNKLDPYLYALLNSRIALTNANAYAQYIDRTLHKFYIKGDYAHLILDVNKKEEIPVTSLIGVMNSTLNLIDLYNDTFGEELDKDSIQIKLNVQSPGPIEFLAASSPVIIAMGIVLIAIVGGDFKAKYNKHTGLDVGMKTQGFLGRVLQFREQAHKQKLAEQKTRLLSYYSALHVSTPETPDGDDKLVSLLPKEDN